MTEYILANKNTDNDRQAVQDAIETAYSTGIGTVLVPSGEWKLDGALFVPEYTRIILDGARLVLDEGCDEENAIRNSNAKTSFGFTNGAMQRGVTISGRNGASVVAPEPVFLRNVENFTVEDLTLVSTRGFAIFAMMCIHGKIRGINFDGCAKGVGVGATSRDCFFYGISGSVQDIAFDFDNALHRDMSFTAKGYDIINHIVKDVNVTSDNGFARIDGEGKINPVLSDRVGSIVFDKINVNTGDVPAFEIKSAFHITLSDVTTSGALVNEGLTPEQIYIYDKTITERRI